MLEALYNAIATTSAMASDEKGLVLVEAAQSHALPDAASLKMKEFKKGVLVHPVLKNKDKSGKWWFVVKSGDIYLYLPSDVFQGWVKDAKGWWYVLKGYNSYINEWRRIRGLWYEFDEAGYIKCSQWSTYKGRKRYLKADGSMANGETLTIDGKKYRFEEGGAVIEP